MRVTKTVLWDRRGGGGGNNEIEAEILRDLVPLDVIEASREWAPFRLRAMRRLLAEGFPPQNLPQHYHWDWETKAARLPSLSHTCVGIRCNGDMQGLMMLDLGGHFARFEPDETRPLVYIDYLETSPRNLYPFVAKPEFGGVGTRLFKEAIEISIEEEFHGRVGLHSLPQAEVFYATSCGMTPGDPDADHQGLRYYELTREHANQYLRGA